MTEKERLKARLIKEFVTAGFLIGDAPVPVPAEGRMLHPSSHMHGPRSDAQTHNALLAIIEEVFGD